MDERLLWMVPGLVLGLGLWRPRFGLLVLAAALPLFGTPPAGPYLAILDVSGLCAVLIGIRARLAGSAPGWSRGAPLPLALAAWVLVSLAAALPLVYQPPAWSAGLMAPLIRTLVDTQASTLLYSWRVVFQLMTGLGIFWSVRVVFRERSVRPLAVALGLGVACLVVLGAAEQAGLVDLAAYRSIGDPLYDLRLHSLFFHSGWLAQYLVIATPFAVAGLMSGGPWWRRAGLGLVGLTLICLLLTQQRGAWVATLVQTSLALVILGPTLLRRRRVVVALVLVAVSAVLGVLAFASTDSSVAQSVAARLDPESLDLSGRSRVWRRSLDASWEGNLAGTGLGTFGVAYERLYPCRWQCWLTAHNLYVHTLFERGLPGLLALLLVMVATTGVLRRTLADPPDEPTRVLTVGLALSLAGAAVYGLAQHILFIEAIDWLLWILLAATTLVQRSPDASGHRRPWVAVGVGVVVLALVAIPVRRSTVPPFDGPSQASFGLRATEAQPDGSSVRWTSGDAAQRLPWRSERLLVELTDGHPLPEARDLEVVAFLNGREAWRGSIDGSWSAIELEAGPPQNDTLVLGLSAAPTFRPWRDYRRHPELGASRDIRDLGVAIGNVEWKATELQDFELSSPIRHTDPYWITLGDLGAGPYVVGAGARLELEAPTVIFVNGVVVEGELAVGNPR